MVAHIDCIAEQCVWYGQSSDRNTAHSPTKYFNYKIHNDTVVKLSWCGLSITNFR